MLELIEVDYQNARQAADLLRLLNNYALDPMGGAQPLPEYTQKNLIKRLAERPGTVSLLAYQDGLAVGLVNAFEGFSTFQCRPLLNIHDVCVERSCRRQGIALQMLARLEDIARQRGCCKLTLEVLQGNKPARQAYKKLGFRAYELDPAMGQALFWEKSLG